MFKSKMRKSNTSRNRGNLVEPYLYTTCIREVLGLLTGCFHHAGYKNKSHDYRRDVLPAENPEEKWP